MIDAPPAGPIARPVVRTLTLLSTHRMFIGDLTSPVGVQLWRDWETKGLTAEVSHGIFTPLQVGPHIPSVPTYCVDPEYALSWISNKYAQFFSQATEAGHVPSELWLVSVAR